MKIIDRTKIEVNGMLYKAVFENLKGCQGCPFYDKEGQNQCYINGKYHEELYRLCHDLMRNERVDEKTDYVTWVISFPNKKLPKQSELDKEVLSIIL